MSTSNKEKNAQIKATLLATRERRKLQKCFVFSTKICYNKLNNQQKDYCSSQTERWNNYRKRIKIFNLFY